MAFTDIDYSEELILVIDGDSRFRATLEKLLAAVGITAHSVSSGNEALNMLKKNDFTIVLADIFR